MSAPAALVGVGLRALLARRINSLSDAKRWSRLAVDAQRDQLRWLLDRAAHTEFGRDHDFPRLAHAESADLISAFRAAVPIHNYDDLFPQLRRMRENAERDVLWPGVIYDWAQTSGTTSGDKFIPVSEDMLKHNYRAALDVYAHATRFGLSLPRIFAGKILFLGGSTDLTTNEHGIRTGDLSGLATRLIRWPISSVVLPSKKTALLGHWPTKIERMAAECVNADIRWISGMPSWGIVLFERVMELAREQGRQVNCLRDLWPNLQIFVHGGVNFTPFERRIREVWSGDPDGPDIPTRLEVYPASEGFIAIQDTPGDPGLRLNVDHHVFYEFVPIEEIHAPSPTAHACWEVEKGQRYVVVMTTCAGLWRYIIGDVVEFDSIPPAGPPRLRIVGRHRLFINAFGENLIVEHIENAVASASEQLEITVGEFTAAPIYPGSPLNNGRSGLQLAIEWEGDQSRIHEFADALDKAIKHQNVDYTTKRTDNLGMAPPLITPLPIGAFHKWMESRGKLGGQHKCPRCANNRDIIDDVLRENVAFEPPQVNIPGQPTLSLKPE